MTDGLRFSWELSGSGWATCRIANGSSELKRFVSYCTDALADLLNGVAGLYGPDPVQRFSFDLEPVEVRWVLRSKGPDVDIAIHQFPDIYKSFGVPDREGTLAWASTHSRSRLSHVVLHAAQSVLQLHGEGGYLAQWKLHPFPLASLQNLRDVHLQHDGCALRHDDASLRTADSEAAESGTAAR
ncbi:hypothetical protein ADK86_21715 [Streptomyces sp. NRRL F-5755]|uniref:hypothetical protein n=1 Tax=Streptomyces sp. NRRL F-5755 TaxID=1519475 RepID=UPI0006AFA7C7|nr:hypothetical protein [Streptomyces sp. NRRL F-5755]KOT91879.1 hypothetical protein ADK86_21715 [Streptomyces sp. NRRL F-5755]